MLDDLRDDAGYLDEDDSSDYEYQEAPPVAGAQTQFLGMTPQQRFVIAVMLLMMVCILGAFFLLITGSIALPV